MLSRLCKLIMAGCSATLTVESDAIFFRNDKDPVQISDHVYYLTGESSFGVMLNVTALKIDSLALKNMHISTSRESEME